ncbi:MAG TPA: hypothetical protein VMW65_14820 [Chloroflexota bacterium]|nr:hypothetical protein [Chloroflexota bacterium]
METNQSAIVNSDAAAELLQWLKLRQTQERLATTQLLLENPGLSARALAAKLSDRGADVHRRTLQRILGLFRSPDGCFGRWHTVGPLWVCWGCGQAIARADADTTASLQAKSVLPLDLGGYCVHCQASLVGDEAERAPGLRPSRATSVVANRRATIVSVNHLYQNPRLMRELLGSDRRSSNRDYTIANFVENPRTGPVSIQRALETELPAAPSLRSVKQISSLLHQPKAQILFSRLGTIGWSCLACTTWGIVAEPAVLWSNAPDRFAPTDVRALCPTCLEQAHQLAQ